MHKIYAALLCLYPAEHRATFGSEMTKTFDQAAMDCRKRGLFSLCAFTAREFGGLVAGFCHEWAAKLAAGEAYLHEGWQPLSEANSVADIAGLQTQLKSLISCMEFAIANHDFSNARRYSDEERAVREQMNELLREKTNACAQAF